MSTYPGADGNGLTIQELFSVRPGVGLTFDDFNILPRFVESPPPAAEVDLKVDLANGLRLFPLISSPMDTVTEWKMAVQMALNGCLGVLHINLDPNEAVRQIKKVKRFRMGFIWDPECLSPDNTVADAKEKMAAYGYSTFPITEGGERFGKFLGLLTKTCVDLQTDSSRALSEVMLPMSKLVTPNFRDVPTLDAAKDIFLGDPSVSKLPILADDGTISSLVNRSNVVKSGRYPDILEDDNKQLRIAAAVSTHPEDEDRAYMFIDAGVDIIVIDSSQGGTGFAIKRIKQIRERVEQIKNRNPEITVIAGNVVTPNQAAPLLAAGADLLRVGMGSGSICITQGQYGLGRAQGSATYYVPGQISDGGIRSVGDIIKALALGARFAMVGRYVAGSDESPSALIRYRGRDYKRYRGMGSAGAMQDRGAVRYGGKQGYDPHETVEQGVEGLVPAIGSLDNCTGKTMAAIRGFLSQLGCSSIDELHREVLTGNIRFELRSDAARREGAVHDLEPLPQ